MDCCDSNKTNNNYDFDLAIIGSGSAAFAAAIKATELGKTVLIIEKGTLGGTCVNVGCVPSKNLIRAAEAKHRADQSNFSGVTPNGAKLDFADLIAGKDRLVDDLRAAKYQSVLEQNKDITFIEGFGRFIDQNKIDIDGKVISAEKILISTGSRAVIPKIDGLDQVDYLTSTTAFELKELPETMAVIGGGYIALEVAQLFHRLGTKVTIVQRSRLLSGEDENVSSEICKHFQDEGIQVLEESRVEKVSQNGLDIELQVVSNESKSTFVVNKLVFASGRVPALSGLKLENAGVKVDEQGCVSVNEFSQTSQANIYAAGDVLSSPALVYVAAYEGNLAAGNAFSENSRKLDYSSVPWVVFSDPQVSGVGLSEKQAQAEKIEYDVSLLTMEHVPRAIAAQDIRGFIKLLRRKGTDELIGARVVGPEGSELIMEPSLMIKYKIPISDVATMMHPYLTLSETVKLALQTFDKDVSTLSCCAS